MVDEDGKYRCDGTRANDSWCGRRAAWEIETEYCWLHYCAKCKPSRTDNPNRYFKAKPGAIWRPIMPR